MSEWRTKSKDGKAVRGKDGKPIRFAIEPHGDKRSLPRSLQRVAPVEELSDLINRKRNKTPEERVEDALIEEAVDEEEKQKNLLEKLGEGLNKIDKAIKKQQKIDEYRAAMQEVRDEHLEDETAAIENGYGQAWSDNIDAKRKAKRKDLNPLFEGDTV